MCRPLGIHERNDTANHILQQDGMPEFGQPLCVVPLLDSSATGYGCLVPPLRLSSNVPPSNGDKDLSGLYAACRSEKRKNRKPDTA